MDELSDDECNLLRYCAETERIASSMGQMLRRHSPTPAVRLSRAALVGRENPLLLIFSGMIPGGQDKFEYEFSF